MRKSISFSPIFRHAFLGFAVIVIAIPILFTFSTSLKLPRDVISGSFTFEPTLRNYEELFVSSRSNFPRLTLNSLVASAGTTIIILIVASLAAYSLSRFRWPGLLRGLALGWLLMVHMLPPIIFIGPFYLISRQIHIYDTPLAVMMGQVVMNLPLAFFILFDFFAAVPRELEDAARIDGCNHLQAFLRVLLPIIQPGLAAAAVLVFIFSWRDFLVALSLTSTPNGMTIPVGIAGFVQEYSIRYGEMSAAAIFAIIPALILVIIGQRHIVKGLTLGSLKG